MKTTVKISMNDVEEIVNKISQGGGKLYTALEKALAEKCKRLYDNLEKANDEKNRLFGILYRNYIGIPSELRKVFDEKRANELLNESKRLFSRSVKMNSEAAGLDAVTMNPPYTTPEEVMKVVTGQENEESKEG